MFALAKVKLGVYHPRLEQFRQRIYEGAHENFLGVRLMSRLDKGLGSLFIICRVPHCDICASACARKTYPSTVASWTSPDGDIECFAWR